MAFSSKEEYKAWIAAGKPAHGWSWDGKTIEPKDKVKSNKPKHKKLFGFIPLSTPVPCRIVDVNGDEVARFDCKKDARLALAAIIKNLPPRKSEDEPKKYRIENL